LVDEVAMRNLIEGSLSASCWRGEFTAEFLDVRRWWVVLNLYWSSCVVRCS